MPFGQMNSGVKVKFLLFGPWLLLNILSYSIQNKTATIYEPRVFWIWKYGVLLSLCGLPQDILKLRGTDMQWVLLWGRGVVFNVFYECEEV